MPAKRGHLPPPSVIAEQERTAYRLHLRRVPHADIAQRLGLSLATTDRRVEAGREAYTKPDEVEILRQDLGAQLDEEYRTVSTIQAAADDQKTKLAASAQLVKINESYRKLFAVDSPTPLEAALTGRAEVESELIGRAAAAMAERADRVLSVLDADPQYRADALSYILEGGAMAMEHADGDDMPQDTAEAPRPLLAITAGSPDGPDHDGATTRPRRAPRDAVDGILAQVDRILEEDDDDEDEEDDQE